MRIEGDKVITELYGARTEVPLKTLQRIYKAEKRALHAPDGDGVRMMTSEAGITWMVRMSDDTAASLFEGLAGATPRIEEPTVCGRCWTFRNVGIGRECGECK